jgi:hypothetical protein
MKLSADNLLRRIVFRPYATGAGPSFTLTLWDTGEKTDPTHYRLAYRLTQVNVDGTRAVLFRGSDFGCPIYISIDSRECVRSLMSFLTLRPGDTDREYFDSYTKRQQEYCAQHAEALCYAVDDRFGTDR